ncbi:MAG TPA: DoxX family protein [Phototrophicaceae bacterium]|nr:DoxX family protein [Phototrophicaceae bacterium]
MNTAIWAVQILLALAFGMAGFMKVTQPREKLAPQMGWVMDFSPNIVKVIGGLELLAALGLILPALTGILTWLTPLAASGLVLVMIGASLTHIRRWEYPMVAINLVLLALALFVAYGRFVAVPLVPALL